MQSMKKLMEDFNDTTGQVNVTVIPQPQGGNETHVYLNNVTPTQVNEAIASLIVSLAEEVDQNVENVLGAVIALTMTMTMMMMMNTEHDY